MRASHLRTGSAPITFRMSFGHAAATRDRAENVLVEVRDSKGRYGLGEGCPRSYVTGEDVPGALAFLAAHRDALLAIEDLQGLKAWIATNTAAIDINPSAFCAAELALIDLFARQAGQDIETFLRITRASDPIRVSAVYGSGKAVTFHLQATLFGLNGMRDSKLKITGDASRDLARAKSLARSGRVRLDANNLWPDAEAALPSLSALAPHAWAVEEPIRPRDWSGLSRIARETGLAIIFDESLLTLADLDAAPKDISLVPNLRVSKQGGLLRSLDLLARIPGPVIVGAQVGETSILARSGLALAHAAGARLTGFECAYAPLLLSHDVVTPSLGFGRFGRVRQGRFVERPGFGLALRSTSSDMAAV
jgi:L-alanine-DL-glutamate epimerase-like enolase superfamily enzyme